MSSAITKSILFVIVLVSTFFSFGQEILKGRVTDADTEEPLAFVTIILNNDRTCFRTDIDGKFTINYSGEINTLRFSYVGYEQKEYEMSRDTKFLKVEMKKKHFDLQEVIIVPGENPAHRIIINAYNHRDENNPEKQKSFSYLAYNKFVVTANLDSLKTKNPEVLNPEQKKTKTFFDNQNLFLMESITERKFLFPDKNSEKILASKISGFSDPLFTLFMTQIQSFSFYNDLFTISDKNYLNPISKGSTDKYFFLLEDTLYEGKDSVFVISYHPKKNKNFDGLKGLLYINSNGWAVQSVIAEPASEETGPAVKIQQNYAYINNKQWFPVQLNTDIYFKNISLNKLGVYGQSRSYLKEIVLDPELKKKEFGISEVEIENNSTNKDENFWTQYRIDSLSAKDRRTYRVIDSIGKAAHLDRKVGSMMALSTGAIPWHFLNLDMDRFIDFNDYEGFRLGAGVHTNRKTSDRWNIGGYVAYGFKDKLMKYGGDATWHLYKKMELDLKASYLNDITESGAVNFFDDKKLFGDEQYRKYLVEKFDKIEKQEASLSWRMLKYLNVNLAVNDQHRAAFKDYQFGVSNSNVIVLVNEFNFAEALLGLKFTWKEKFIDNAGSKISMGTKYPIVWLQYTHGFNNFLDGEYLYNRIDFKFQKSFFVKGLGKPSFMLLAGFIDGNIPYSILYNGRASYRLFTVYAPNSFATMEMNEFLSDRYVSLFFTHRFGKLLFHIRKLRPEFAVATNIGFGSLNNSNHHYNIEIKTMEKGFFESGLMLENLLNATYYKLGAGIFYRYGPYAKEKTADDFSYKLTFTFPF